MTDSPSSPRPFFPFSGLQAKLAAAGLSSFLLFALFAAWSLRQSLEEMRPALRSRALSEVELAWRRSLEVRLAAQAEALASVEGVPNTGFPLELSERTGLPFVAMLAETGWPLSVYPPEATATTVPAFVSRVLTFGKAAGVYAWGESWYLLSARLLEATADGRPATLILAAGEELNANFPYANSAGWTFPQVQDGEKKPYRHFPGMPHTKADFALRLPGGEVLSSLADPPKEAWEARDGSEGDFTVPWNGRALGARRILLPAGDTKLPAVLLLPEEALWPLPFRKIILSSVLAGLFLLLAFLFFTGRLLVRDLDVLRRAVEDLGGGNLEPPAPSSRRDEVGALSRALTEAVASLRDQDRLRAILGKHVPPETARRLLSGAEGFILEGERRHVALLAADIRGFSALAATLPPREAVRSLNAWFTLLSEEAFRRGGIVDKLFGDKFLAVFGAPAAHPQAGRAALQAALGAREALRRLNAERVAKDLPALNGGLAVHFGEVVAGNLGAERMPDYSVAGEPVAAAYGLAARCAPGRILVSETLAGELGGAPPGERLAPLALSGVPTPVTAFEIGPNPPA